MSVAVRQYKAFPVAFDWMASHRTLRVRFEERITRSNDRTYTRDTVANISDNFVREVLQEIFADLHVRDITVKHRTLVIRHNGSKQGGLEARVLMALRAQDKDVVV